MCGRLACTLSKEEIICQLAKQKNCEPTWILGENEYKPFYNGPPTTNVPVLTSKSHFKDAKSDVCVATMKWGLLPQHIPPEGFKSLHTHNARFETVQKSPLYSPCLVKGRRCIVLAEGYYEWQTKAGINNKQPFFFYQEAPKKDDTLLTSKQLIKFAGIFNETSSNGKVEYSCTIITKESDETLDWVHYRMPIILNTEEEVTKWLDNKNVKLFDAIELISNIDSHKKAEYKLKNYPVKTLVNKVTNNDKSCMEKITLKRKSTALTDWLVPKKKKEN